MTPLFGDAYKRAKAANSKEEFIHSQQAASVAVAWGTSFVGSGLQSYGVAALINATGTLSYKGAAYLGALIFMATSAPAVCLLSCLFIPSLDCSDEKGDADRDTQYLNDIFVQKRPLDTIGINAIAKVLETVGLSCFLTWWGTRTNPFE